MVQLSDDANLAKSYHLLQLFAHGTLQAYSGVLQLVMNPPRSRVRADLVRQ